MTNEELNTALYEKMFTEQTQFLSQLITRTPIEILDMAYEYRVREGHPDFDGIQRFE